VLADALRDLARTCSERDGLPVELRIDEPVPPLPAASSEHLVRIAGEALHNAVKHAAASGATLALGTAGPELVLTITDDGRGFDPAGHGRRGHGQQTMRERAGLCGGSALVESAPGRGTRVQVRIPLPA
jgi:signal transduction histidine kinase